MRKTGTSVDSLYVLVEQALPHQQRVEMVTLVFARCRRGHGVCRSFSLLVGVSVREGGMRPTAGFSCQKVEGAMLKKMTTPHLAAHTRPNDHVVMA